MLLQMTPTTGVHSRINLLHDMMDNVNTRLRLLEQGIYLRDGEAIDHLNDRVQQLDLQHEDTQKKIEALNSANIVFRAQMQRDMQQAKSMAEIINSIADALREDRENYQGQELPPTRRSRHARLRS